MGGGGLVQQLRKSYSLSDLTGEKEDENCNNKSTDETDYNELRVRERTGRRNYSPRRTQSSGNQMDMYFSEVDVQVRQSRSRDAVESLTNIKSSDDISSGYSSGEALQSQKNAMNREHLVRTASLGARNRIKPRSSIKKTPEVRKIEEDDVESIEQLTTVNPLSLFYSEKALEMLSFLSGHRNYMKMLQYRQDLSDSDDDSSTLKADPVGGSKTKSASSEKIISSTADTDEDEEFEGKLRIRNSSSHAGSENRGVSAEKAALKILLPEKKLNSSALPTDKTHYPVVHNITNLAGIQDSPSVSPSNSLSDFSERAGRYHKRPAPRAPDSVKGEDDADEQPVKATLVIKAGTLKSFTNNEAVDAVIRRRKKLNARTAARDSFTKMLTIPKNIFHSTFTKDKEEDAKATTPERPLKSTKHEDITNDTDTSETANAVDEKSSSPAEAGVDPYRKCDSDNSDYVAAEISRDERDAEISELQTHKEETVV